MDDERQDFDDARIFQIAKSIPLYAGEQVDICVASETPVEFRFGGIAHAVTMATPQDLEDLAYGFSLTEGVASSAADLRNVDLQEATNGMTLRIDLTPDAMRGFLRLQRRRNLRSLTSCGLCGVEDLRSVPQRVPCRRLSPMLPEDRFIRRALGLLREHQPLSRSTRCAHAAAWCSAGGEPLIVREDVGRHNALDKLIGAVVRSHRSFDDGFVVITSRCSFEMVQKAIAAGIGALVAISAPTALAIKTAKEAGVALIGTHGSGDFCVFTADAFAQVPSTS